MEGLSNQLPLSDVTLNSIQGAALTAELQHKDKALHRKGMPLHEKMYALMEEIGEAAQVLTYDAGGRPAAPWRQPESASDRWHRFEREMVQVAYCAAAIVEAGMPEEWRA